MTNTPARSSSIPKWGGRRAQRARTWTLARDHGTCWICGHTGANSLDHIQSRTLRPDLTWNPTNWAAAHMQRAGQPGGCTHPSCTCIGNRLRSAGQTTQQIEATTTQTTEPEPSREW